MRHQHAKMIASQHKLIVYIPVMVIKIASASAHVIMRLALIHVHAIRGAIMAVHARMKANIVALARRVLKKSILFVKT